MNPEILSRFADSQRFFTCPVCSRPLSLQGTSLMCKRKHCFDLSKYGYVNLAPQAKQSKAYDRQSFEHRQTILEHGFYNHILEALAALLEQTPRAKAILDAGCGEGFYSRRLEQRTGLEFLAFDLSRDSIQLAAKSDEAHRVKWFVGDLTHLPLKDHSIDCVLDLFTRPITGSSAACSPLAAASSRSSPATATWRNSASAPSPFSPARSTTASQWQAIWSSTSG